MAYSSKCLKTMSVTQLLLPAPQLQSSKWKVRKVARNLERNLLGLGEKQVRIMKLKIKQQLPRAL